MIRSLAVTSALLLVIFLPRQASAQSIPPKPPATPTLTLTPPPAPFPPLVDLNPPLPPGIGRTVFSHPRLPTTQPARRTSACPNPATCTDYSYSGVKWTNPGSVSVVVDTDNPYQLDQDQVYSAISDSFAVWEVANTSGKLNFLPTRDDSANPDPNVSTGANTVSFRPLSDPNTIGVTTLWYYIGTKKIIKFDLILNTDPGQSWSLNSYPAGCIEFPVNTCIFGNSSYDVTNITTHEVGHTLMLNDLYRSRDSELTMYGYGLTGELKKTTLGYGDILGLNRIYP